MHPGSEALVIILDDLFGYSTQLYSRLPSARSARCQPIRDSASIACIAISPLNPPYSRTSTAPDGHSQDTAPRERWNCDILGGEGEQRFKSVVEEIHQACVRL